MPTAIKSLIIAHPEPTDNATTRSSVSQRNDGRTGAYDAGRDAHHAGLISLGARTLYEQLVFWSGEQGYCWHGVKRIAQDLLRSVSQIGRWLHELTSAALIRRVRQRTGPAVTHITAYDPDRASMTDPDRASMRDRSIKATRESKELEAEAKGRRQDVQLDTVSVIDTIGPAHHQTVTVPVTPATERLRAVGVQAPAVLVELKDRPVAEVQAAIDEAKGRTNVQSFPGLVVKMVKDGIWGGRRRKAQPARERTIEDYKGYCPVCLGYPFCTCEAIIALAEEPPPALDPAFCTACWALTHGAHLTGPCPSCGAEPPDGEVSRHNRATDGAREDDR